MHETLVLCCHAGLRETGHTFGNLFSQVDYLCKRHIVSVADKIAIQTMRRHSNSRHPLSREELLLDARALCRLISAVFDCDIPAALTGRLPQVNGQRPAKTINQRYIRCLVREVTEDYLSVDIDQEGAPDHALVRLTDENRGIDHRYLTALLKTGTQLNLLDCHLEEEWIEPTLIIVEPDFLVDISTIAACFTAYGHHPLLYFLNQMKPKANTQAILLGNLAGMALDDLIHAQGHYQFKETIKKHFQEQALEYACCPEFQSTSFIQDARIQTQNLQQVVNLLFHSAESFDPSKAILEPSFVCEALGIQGRVDLMTTDFRLLVEQKSGRNIHIERQCPDPRHHSFQLEPHYVQLLLYYGVLRYNFHTGTDHTDIRLLYSKYPPKSGLVSVSFYQTLFREALQYRNQVVAEEFDIACRGFGNRLDQLTPESLNVKRCNDYFYQNYLQPQLARMTSPLHQLSQLERDYFNRMMTFVVREQVVSKVGMQEGHSHALSDLWNMPLAEKKETGNIYTGLRLKKIEMSSASHGYDTITLAVPEQGPCFLPNFRTGDMVYLYGYPEQLEPDARKTILLTGILQEIRTDQLTVHLHNGQQNPQLFSFSVYAVEHGTSDVATNFRMRNLYHFLSAPQEKRDLLLGQRAPQKDSTAQLSRHYDTVLDPILLKARQARDYFLLVGPPGTGKTSRALQLMVREALSENETSSILLMAYTNRAVDEICDMLHNHGIDFLRMGYEWSCEERFRPYLISQLAETCPKLPVFRQRLLQTRVVVGTTTMMASKEYLFQLKSFHLAIVDEASQLLEPNLIGLLTQVRKFILIGDYKQLPAVVQLDKRDSRVTEQSLVDIGLDDCRHSLFERLIRQERRQHRTDFIGILDRQGRMHPDIAAFPNRMFYAQERLQPVPCRHQTETALYGKTVIDRFFHRSTLDQVLLTHRMVFLPSPFCHVPGSSDQVNPSEALLTARCLKNLYEYDPEHFDPEKTVGVIVPYRNQIAMIRNEIEHLGIPQLREITTDTIERYQGSQRDVILYSFTIQYPYQLEFLTADCFMEDGRLIDRKLNVALTRARKQLILTGNPEILSTNLIFRQLMDYCKDQKGYLEDEIGKSR